MHPCALLAGQHRIFPHHTRDAEAVCIHQYSLDDSSGVLFCVMCQQRFTVLGDFLAIPTPARRIDELRVFSEKLNEFFGVEAPQPGKKILQRRHSSFTSPFHRRSSRAKICSYLVSNCFCADTRRLEQSGCKRSAYSHDPQEHMLRIDTPLSESLCFIRGQIQSLPAFHRQRYLYRSRESLPPRDVLLDLRTNVSISKKHSQERLVFVRQAKQKVFCLDERTSVPARLVASEEDDTPRFFCVTLEHDLLRKSLCLAGHFRQPPPALQIALVMLQTYLHARLRDDSEKRLRLQL
jgi:hypothetical protein